jgi:hypothetical protein
MPSEKSLSFLQAIYFDATATIRHYDSSRTTFVQLFAAVLVLLTSASVFAAGESDGIRRSIILTASAVATILTAIGAAIVLRFNSLILLQRERAKLSMRQFEELSGEAGLSLINAEARTRAHQRSIWLPAMGSLWVAMFAAIGAGNVLIFAIAWQQRS